MFKVKSNVDVMDHQPDGQQQGDGLESASGRQKNSPVRQYLQYLKKRMRTVSVV